MSRTDTSRKLSTSTALAFAVVGFIVGSLACGLFGDSVTLTSDSPEKVTDCQRPNYYNYVSPIREDADEDLMDDQWELRNGLDIENRDDALLDPDGDGYSNREEYESGSDPQSAIYNPGIQIVNRLGFNCFYVAAMGYINGDELLDVLIRDPSEGYYPAIRDFLLIQQADRSFILEDASSYELPELSSIQSTLVLSELNGDWSKDIVLLGLSDHIPDVNDQIIFGPVCELCAFIPEGELPTQHVEVGPEFASFFQELDEWVRSFNGSYFDDSAPVIASVPEIVELAWMTDSEGSHERGTTPLSLEILVDECEVGLVRCYPVLADDIDLEDSTIYDSHWVSYSPVDYQVDIVDRENDPGEPDYYYVVMATFSEQRSYAVKDYSGFNQDALRLAQNELYRIREAGIMWYPSQEADAVYATIRKYLGSPLLFNSFYASSLGEYSLGIEFEHILSREIMGSIQRVLTFVTQRFIRERFG